MGKSDGENILWRYVIEKIQEKVVLPDGESNPGLPRDRRGYLPLYYRGWPHGSSLTFYIASHSTKRQSQHTSTHNSFVWLGVPPVNGQLMHVLFTPMLQKLPAQTRCPHLHQYHWVRLVPYLLQCSYRVWGSNPTEVTKHFMSDYRLSLWDRVACCLATMKNSHILIWPLIQID